jgi:hypothetical protein
VVDLNRVPRPTIGVVALVFALWPWATPAAGQRPGPPGGMGGHFDGALEVHAAVIGADLVSARTRAATLARALGSAPSGEGPRAAAHAAAVEAARSVARTADVLGAARATAAVLGACGRCHTASGVSPAVSQTAPGAVDTLAGRMRAHRQAADLLLQGLIAPSDAAWRDGARQLATAPLHDATLPVDPAVHASLAAAEQRFHRLATDAAQVTDARGREAFYAQFLAGCADCHTRHGRRQAPGR